MTTYVVDASVVVQLLVNETYSAEATALFTSIDTNNKIIVPEFGLMECANVVWKHVRFHDLSQSDAQTVIQQLVAFDIVIAPTIGLMPRALEIGLKHSLAIYDSAYIALAEKLNYALITVDQKQANVAEAEGVLQMDIADFTPEDT